MNVVQRSEESSKRPRWSQAWYFGQIAEEVRNEILMYFWLQWKMNNKSRKTLWLSVFYGFFCALGFSADKRNLSFVRPPIQNHTRNSDEVSLIGAQSDTGQATPAAPHPHHHGPWCTTLWVCFFYSKLHSFIYYPASANWIVNEKQTCVYIVCCFQIYPFEIERRTDNTVIIWFFTYFHTRHIMVQINTWKGCLFSNQPESQVFLWDIQTKFPKRRTLQDVRNNQ